MMLANQLTPATPDSVVANGSNGARDMRAMKMIVKRIARFRDGVESVRAGGTGDRLPANGDAEAGRRRPDVSCQVRMCVVDAGVDDPDHGVARPERAIPGGDRADVSSGSAGDSTDVCPILCSPHSSGNRGSFGSFTAYTM